MPDSSAIAALQKEFPGRVGQAKEFRGESTVEIDRDLIRPASAFLKQLGYNFLVDISSIDYFGDEPRYEIVYEFCALGGTPDQDHLRLKLKVSEVEPTVDSIISVYQGADWHEREIYDMMGLVFNGHPDLRRILMWEGYPYHPLKKDFPLEGLPSDLPGEDGFSRPAPMEGGPYVAAPTVHQPKIGDAPTTRREPRAQPADR